ncbi:MAG TPA: PadR family transcriptional regulator [Dehalococcoidia bacterium]|nr:PadR family transcriptional regulator [Dehalococcoidia bacterium]
MVMFRDRVSRGERFFRGFRHDSPFQKGDLKYVILDLLKDKPRYGYEIIRALEERSHGFYKPSAGVVYPTLQMLEEMGYASSAERDGKKVYTITAEGNQFLVERRDSANEVRSHMRHHWNPKNIGPLGEIMGEVAKLGKLVGPRIRNAEPTQLHRISELISRTRREIEAILEE